MANNTPQNEITEQHEMNGVVTSMNYKLGLFFFVPFDNCCIYQVPEFILKGHEYFYQPSVMSIGPVYYKNPKLATMQKVKWIYLNWFLQNPNNARRSVDPYIDYVREREVEIRSSYQQESSLSSDVFVEMIVLDAAFLIYVFMAFGKRKATLPFEMPIPYVGKLQTPALSYFGDDLYKLENQIPYFVLKGIFIIAFGHICTPITLINATLTFISDMSSGIPGSKAIESIIDGNKITDESNIQHLLDLQRMSCCLSLSTPLLDQPNPNPMAASKSNIHCQFGCVEISLNNRQRQHHLETHDRGYHRLCYTAKQLIDAGVTFVAGETDNPLDVTFADGILTISKFETCDPTETILRNLVYYEQCHYLQDFYLLDYIIFLDELIDTVEDVQVLVQNKILTNLLGSDEDVVKLFNNIGKNVPVSYEVYSDVNDALNCYASKRRNQWMAILRSKYFNHPWTILSVIAAIILFVLTLLQTIAAYIYK